MHQTRRRSMRMRWLWRRRRRPRRRRSTLAGQFTHPQEVVSGSGPRPHPHRLELVHLNHDIAANLFWGLWGDSGHASLRQTRERLVRLVKRGSFRTFVRVRRQRWPPRCSAAEVEPELRVSRILSFLSPLIALRANRKCTATSSQASRWHYGPAGPIHSHLLTLSLSQHPDPKLTSRRRGGKPVDNARHSSSRTRRPASNRGGSRSAPTQTSLDRATESADKPRERNDDRKADTNGARRDQDATTTWQTRSHRPACPRIVSPP